MTDPNNAVAAIVGPATQSTTLYLYAPQGRGTTTTPAINDSCLPYLHVASRDPYASK